MIKNERQYKFTQTQVKRFERTLAELRSRNPEDTGLHPLVAKAQEDAVSGQIVDLKEELHLYESMRAGTFSLNQLEVVSELSNMLIGARIAQGISQKELAERIGLGAADSALRGDRLRLGQSGPDHGSRQWLEGQVARVD